MRKFTRGIAPLVLIAAAVVLMTTCAERDQPAPSSQEAGSVVSHGATDLTWETDWQRAFATAKSEDKVVLANFYADWCIWCKRLDSTTMRDPDVTRLLSTRCVPLKLDIDRAGRDRARQLRVEGPPTLIVLDSDGREIGRIPGYMPPTGFLKRLEGILQEG